MEVAIFTSHRAYDQISKDSSISALVCLTCGASQERSEDDFAGLTLWRTELPLGTFGRGLCDRALHTDTKGQNVGEAKLGTHSLRVADGSFNGVRDFLAVCEIAVHDLTAVCRPGVALHTRIGNPGVFLAGIAFAQGCCGSAARTLRIRLSSRGRLNHSSVGVFEIHPSGHRARGGRAFPWGTCALAVIITAASCGYVCQRDESSSERYALGLLWTMKVFFKGRTEHVLLLKAPMMVPQPS